MADLPRNLRDVAAASYAGRAGIAYPGGRITINAGNLKADSSNIAVAYSPFTGSLVPIFDGTNFVNEDFTLDGGAILVALDSNAAHTLYHADGNYDLFVFVDNTTSDIRTIRIGSAATWTDAVTRASSGSGFAGGSVSLGSAGGPEGSSSNGVYFNSEEVQLRFGTGANDLFTVNQFMATWVGTVLVLSAEVQDGSRQRHLWNAYNRVPRKLFKTDATDSWNYSTATMRQARADATNQVEVVRGLDHDPVVLSLCAAVISSTATQRSVSVAIGLDDTTTLAADCIAPQIHTTSTQRIHPCAFYSGYPGTGYHVLSWNERGAGTDTQTWLGDSGAPTVIQTGMVGWCMA